MDFGLRRIYFVIIYERSIVYTRRTIAVSHLGYRSDARMIDPANGIPFCSKSNELIPFHVVPSILTLETPNVEEIAKVIWQRQHDALVSGSISYNLKWRDESIPPRFWDEFLLDARAILLLLCKKHIEYQNTR